MTERVQLRALNSFIFAVFLAATSLIDVRSVDAASQSAAISKKTRFIVGLDRQADFHIISLSNPQPRCY